MVFEMSIQDFDDRTHDHMYPHQNGGVDYREGSFISDEVKGYQESGVYHSDSQVGTVFIRISVPELKLQKCLQFELDETVWQAKQRILGSFAKDLKDSINYGLYCPPMNGRAGKFLDEERLLREYPLQGPIGFLEFKYKKRVYKMMHVNVRKLKQLHVKSNLRHFIDYVRTCNIEKLNKISNKGLDPNFHDSSTGETPLCLAASMNKPKCRELIICLAGGGAHLDFRNKKGMTALHVAVIAGNTEAIKTLLDLGVSPNIKDSRSLTPLYYTVCHCSSPGCMEMLLQERAFIGSQDEQGWFEIHHACRQGLVQHLEHLLFYGADMDVQNASGNTALHVCALHNRESCLRVLLFRGASKEILNYSNQSPYESAILAGNDALAEIIEGHKNEDVVPFRETPRFSTRRRDSVASAAMYALYRSRSDPRINQILISPSSSTQSFSHLHNSMTTDSYSGSRGTDSPCSMSLSSSSSGPGFFGKGASASFPLRRPMSVCQSHFPEHSRPTFQSQFEIIKKRLTPANSFRSLQSRDRLDIEFHKDLQRRLSLQFELRKRSQYYQNLTVPRSHVTRSQSSDQGSDTSSTKLSPSMESIDSVRSQSPHLSTFSSHSGNVYSSSRSVEDSRKCGRDHNKSQNTAPVRNTVCTSDCAIYSVISKPKKHRMPMKIQGRGNVCKQEEIYSNSRIYSESQDKCKSLPNKDLVSRQRSAPAGDVYSFISANHCPPEAKLELETDHIFVCIERYVPRTPEELALEKGDIVEVLGVGEQGFWEGRVNGNEGMFPSNYVHEVKLRRKAGSLGDLVSASRHDMMLNRNTLAAIVPNFSEYAPRSVVLQKGPEGYGFVLRGAKSQTQATGELDFRPSAEFPALQYLDSVDPGSRADRAGLKTGDFILEINGENVVRASHDRVVQLIRQSGDTLALKVVTVKPLEKPDHWLQHHNGTMTLPNRGGTRRQAPQPPQRDPQTSLSVGKAQGKQFTEGMAELDQLDLALAEYERQTVQSVVSSDQKTASIRSKHSAKRVSCVELDKIENPDSKAATTKGKVKDYMSPSEIRIQKYHHKKAGGNLERSSSTPSLVDKKNEAVYATPTVPSTEQNDIGHRRSSSGAAISHIYATPGERPKAPPPPPPSGSSTPSPKRPAPAPPEIPQSEIISISTDRRKSSLSSVTDSLLSTEKPASEYESSFRPGISAQLTTEPKMSTPSLQQAKLRSHNRNSSQVSVNSNDSGGSKRSEEKLGVTFADDKVQDHANLFLQKHPNAQLLVTADVHAKNKDRKMSEPEPDYDSDENDDKVKSKVTVISVGGGSEGSKKYTVKSDIPSGGGGMVIPPPPSEPAPKPPGHKPPSPLPKPAKQDTDIKISFSTEKKVIEENFVKNNETSSVKSEETVSFSSKTPEPEPLNVPPAPPAPPPPPPPPPAPDVSAHVEKPKTPPPVSEKKPKSVVQGIPSKDIMAAVAQRKTRIESEGLKISTGPNKEAPVKDGKDLRNRMIDNTHSAILAAVAKRRALLEEKESDHSVAEEIENRLQKTKKLQSAKYFFSSESIQKKEAEKLNKVETKTETSAKEITPTIVKPTTPTAVSPKTTKPPSPVPSKKTKPPSPSPVRKISPPTPGAKTLPSATKTTTAPNPTKTVEKTQNAPKPIYSSSAKPPSPKLKKAPSPVPIKSPAPETTPDKPKAKAPATPSSPQKDKKDVEKDENEDLLAKAEKARQDWLQKKSSSSSLRSPRDVTRNPSKLNSPRRTASKAGTKTESSETKKESPSSTKTTPKTNGMTLPLKNEESNGTSIQNSQTNTAKNTLQIQSTKSPNKSGITPMKTAKDSDVLMKTRNIKDRIANFEKEKPLVNGKSDGNSKIPVHGVTVDSSLTDKSPALPPPPEFGDALQLEIIPPPSGFNVNDTLESPTYNSAFHHSDSSSVSTLSTLSDDHIDSKTKHSYEDLIAPPPPGFDDNSEDTVPSVIPPPPDFGGNKPAQKSNKTVNKPFLSKPLSNWQCLDVLDWLDSIEMAQYKKSFQQHCIDGKKLNGLQRNDYIQLGVTQVGHRMMMERAIKKASNIVTGTHL